MSGSTTITGGTLVTDSGDSDPTNSIPDHDPVTVAVPTNPAPNTEYTGHIHIGNTTDTFRYVFNEQIVNPDGSITVNAVHQYLLGPSATGDLIIGQVVCGVTSGSAPPPPASGDLAVGVSDAPDPVAVRGQVTYTVTVTNAGPDDADDVNVLTSIRGGKIISTSGATCTKKGKNVSCDLDGVLDHTSDPNTANNSDTETTAIQ